MARRINRGIVVRGIETIAFTDRRFAVVAVRPVDVPAGPGSVYVSFAEVIATSDLPSRAAKLARQNENGPGMVTVVVDLGTGEEV